MSAKPGLLKSRQSTIALSKAPVSIHGRYLPILVLVLSTIMPIIGSLMPSQSLASGARMSRKA